MGPDCSSGTTDDEWTANTESEALKLRSWTALSEEEVPSYVRYDCVTHGYRPVGLSWRELVNSAFTVHNELVNFWTHFVPAVLFPCALLVLYALSWSNLEPLDMLCFGIFFCTASYCLFSSAMYHLFICKSEEVCELLTRQDARGILGLTCASYPSMLVSIFRTMPVTRNLYIAMVLIFNVGTSLFVEFSSYKKLVRYRVQVMLFTAKLGIVPAVHFIIVHDDGKLINAFIYGFLKMAAMYTFGIVIYGTQLPERLFPGKVNIVGHSHQWWHVCVFLASASWAQSLWSICSLSMST
ncbi:hypothetical protein NDN08_004151 [Rhodosorus marinus]|uniref:Uncharacterized protein n=1 Tax=Rhodosorus marinus TaxID=101924 RepID=A0AAV8UHF4_9RHOD|nr:hypothetical protein NDN08_004151 [Rhodosorus marinus]